MSRSRVRISSRAIIGASALFILSAGFTPAYAQTLDDALRNIAEELINQIEGSGIEKIAIVEFTDLNGFQSALGDFVSEELVTNFFVVGSGRFELVERRELTRVLNEQQLGSTGLFDPETIANLGRLLGIQAIVTGSITYLDDDIRINSRMIGVDTARVFAAANATVSDDPIVQQLSRQVGRADNSVTQSGSASGELVQRYDVTFSNSFLQVVLTSASVSSNRREVSFAMDFRNTSNEPLYIATSFAQGLSATSNAGDSLNLRSATGLTSVPSAEVVTNSPDTYLPSFTAVDPGSYASLVVTFRSFGDIEGDTFAFAGSLVRFLGKRGQPFSVGLSRIQVRQ